MRTLGGIDLRTADGVDVRSVLAQPKRLALLAYIALAAPGTFIRRDRLLAVFWPDADPERARAALRDSLYFLRRSLGDVLESRGDEVAIRPDSVQVDALAFRAALDAGEYEDALDLYGGELLPALHVPGAAEFEHWLDAERQRLAVDLRRAGIAAADRAASPAHAIELLRSALGHTPLDEPLLRRLLTAQVDGGDPAAALSAYGDHVARLRRELGIEPSAGMRELAGSLRPAPVSGDVRPERAVAAPLPRTRRLLPALALLGTLALAVFGWFWTQRDDRVAAAARADIVVFPFVVYGNDADYLGEGMLDLLSTKLDGAGGVRAVDPHAVIDALAQEEGRPRDLELGRRIARRFGAGHFVMGSIVEVGTALQLSAYLYDADGEAVARADGFAPADTALFRVVDDLARGLLSGQFERTSELASLAALTTPSLPALRSYLDGERYFREGAFANSLSALQQAVALDSGFALAHYRLSNAADYMGEAARAEQAVRDAWRHRDRLPVSIRALVNARREFWFGDARRAEDLYRDITTSNSASVEGWFEFAEVQFHGGPWHGESLARSQAALREVLALQPGHVSAMTHLARVAAFNRDLALLDSLIARVRVNEPRHSSLQELLALRAGLTRDPAAVDSLADSGISGATAERVAVYTGALDVALRFAVADVARLPPAARAERLQIMAHLHAGLRQWQDAFAALDRLTTIDPVAAAFARANLLTAAFAEPRAEELDRARVALRRLDLGDSRSRAAAHFPASIRAYYLGMLALLAGDTVAAQQELDTLRAPRTDDAAKRFSRSLASLLEARALQRAGRPDAALDVLEADWLPPQKPLVIGWAWSHSNVNARVLRAELLLDLGRFEEADRWLTATYEDIAGSPLVLSYVEALRARARRTTPAR